MSSNRCRSCWENHRGYNFAEPITPVKSNRDHKMQHQKALISKDKYDLFADSLKSVYDGTVYRLDGRFCGSKEKRTRKTNLLKGLSTDKFLMPFDIDGYVWVLRHVLQNLDQFLPYYTKIHNYTEDS